MTLPSPLFSIVIPTYNRAHLIGKTVQSVLNQVFSDFEVLIVDDGSTDNTADVVKEFTDSRVHYFKKKNAERGAARNFGAALAKGYYVNFFDSDDYMYPNHLSVASTLVSSRPPEFFHLGYDCNLEDGTRLYSVNDFTEDIKKKILLDNKLSCNGVFLRRDIALQFPFDENRVLASSEDWHLWIRLVSRFDLVYVNEITSSVINHDQRSLRTIATERIVMRDLYFIDKLKGDLEVMRNYGRTFDRFIAERYTFFMLGFSEQGKKSEVAKWALQAFLLYPLILTSRRFLASIKNSMLK